MDLRGDPFYLVEVLKRYSHPDYLVDLRMVQQAVTESKLGGVVVEPGKPWAMKDRLSDRDVQTMIDLYRGGMIAREVAGQFGISESSVKRLLRRHGGRLKDEN